MEKPIARRLRRASDAGYGHQARPSPGNDILAAEPPTDTRAPSVQVEGAYAVPSTNLTDWSEQEVFECDWTNVSQFFNSKEAEEFSLFQLGSTTFTNEDLQSIYSMS